MNTSIRSLFAMMLFAGVYSYAEEDSVKITTFELKDGRQIPALQFSSLGTGVLKTYSVVNLEGEKITFLEKEIVSRTDKSVALDDLPEPAKNEVLKNRIIAAGLRAEAEAFSANQQFIADAKKKEAGARANLKKVQDELSLAQNILAKATSFTKNAPIEIARAEAQYDAAKTELAAFSSMRNSGGIYYNGEWLGDRRRTENLRNEMTRAAEDKARLEVDKKESESIIVSIQEKMKLLTGRLETAQKEVEADQTEVRQARAKAQTVEQERIGLRQP